jgi:hypothetical protein
MTINKLITQNMKIAFRLMMSIALVALVMGCRDRAAEKRIAELESRLLQLEGGKTTAVSSPTPAAPTAEAPPVQETKPDGPLPVIQYEVEDHDFGTIKEGQKVSFTYKFKNTGDAPLIIQNAQPSCGCTAPDWTREPIPVGGSGL